MLTGTLGKAAMTSLQTQRYATQQGVQKDIQWLSDAWMHIRDDPAYTAMNSDPVVAERLDMFHMRLDACASSDVALRALYGFTGCVFKPKSCPTNGPMRCAGH